MRELEETVLLSADALTSFRLLFGDDGAFFEAFYRETSGEACSVSRWCADGDGLVARRSVRFTKKMELPRAIVSLLGPEVSTLKVVEQQALEIAEERASHGAAVAEELAVDFGAARQARGGGFGSARAAGTRVVRSTPVVDGFPNLESFRTVLLCCLEPTPSAPASCLLRTRCTVEAGLSMGRSLVEGQMEREARASIVALQAYAASWVSRWVAGGGAQDAPPLPGPPPQLEVLSSQPALGEGEAAAPPPAEEELWFDSSDRTLFDATAAAATLGSMAGGEGGASDIIAAAILRELMTLRAIATGSRATLVTLEARVAELQTDIARVRVGLESGAKRSAARVHAAKRALGAAALGMCCVGVVAMGMARRRGESTSEALRAFGNAGSRLAQAFAIGSYASLNALGSQVREHIEQ